MKGDRVVVEGKTGEVSMSNSLILLITMFFSKLN